MAFAGVGWGAGAAAWRGFKGGRAWQISFFGSGGRGEGAQRGGAVTCAGLAWVSEKVRKAFHQTKCLIIHGCLADGMVGTWCAQ